MAITILRSRWVSAAILLSLVLLFAGERIVEHLEGARIALSGAGIALLIACVVTRAVAFAKSSGARRKVEGLTLACYVGILGSMAVYGLTLPSGQSLLGADTASSQLPAALTVLWLITVGCSLLPLLMVEISLGFQQTELDSEEQRGVAIESYRVTDMASSGLTIALAAALMFMVSSIAHMRNVRKDVSYFKTSSPGSAARNIVASFGEPIDVLLFFPEVNEVQNEIVSYFESLSSSAQITIGKHERQLSPTLAKKYKVNKDGTVVLVRGDKHESFTINAKFEVARRKELRELDGTVQKALMSLAREQRTAYFTVGHGEFNDPKSAGPNALVSPLAKVTYLKKLLKALNYRVKNFEGMGTPVPDDCTILFVLGPKVALVDEELSAIDDYLASGGKLLLALDPEGDARLGSLQQTLGLKFHPEILTDDQLHMSRGDGAANNQLILTNQFTSHSAVTTIGRQKADKLLLFIKSGSFEDVAFAGQEKPKRTHIIRTRDSSYRDTNGNRSFDEATEKKKNYNIVSAIESKGPKGDTPDSNMRAVVLADVENFSDFILEKYTLPRFMLRDFVVWLGGEEELAGEVVSEKDKRIEHTKGEDLILYYSTIVGAPIFVLVFGLLGIWIRRRKTKKAS